MRAVPGARISLEPQIDGASWVLGGTGRRGRSRRCLTSWRTLGRPGLQHQHNEDRLQDSALLFRPDLEAASMPKMKRHKGLAKRIRVSARGKLRYNKSNAGHLMSGKSSNRRRKLRKMDTIANVKVARKIRRALMA